MNYWWFWSIFCSQNFRIRVAKKFWIRNTGKYTASTKRAHPTLNLTNISFRPCNRWVNIRFHNTCQSICWGNLLLKPFTHWNFIHIILKLPVFRMDQFHFGLPDPGSKKSAKIMENKHINQKPKNFEFSKKDIHFNAHIWLPHK